MAKRTKVIACGVFERELQALRSALPLEFEVELLDAGLHSNPKELKARLQDAIDSAEPRRFNRIAILYGQCGRGTIGIISRDVPLVLPRVHDCVAMFLGTPEEYRRQFSRWPGTFYMTPGWFEKKAHPDAGRIGSMARKWSPSDDPHFEQWAARYGEENAGAIVEFFQSWRKNYQRIAFINNGLGTVEQYRDYARMMAEVSGWRFEELAGRLDLLRDLVGGPHDEDRFLSVAPHHMVIATNDARIFTAVPADPSEEDVLRAERALSGVRLGRRRVSGGSARGGVRRPRGLGLGIDAGGTYTDAVLLEFETGRVVSKAKTPTTQHDLSIGMDEAVRKLDPDLLPRVTVVSLSTTLATNAIVEGRGAPVGLILMPINELALSQVVTRPVAVVPGKLSIDGREIEPVDPEAVRRAAEEMLTAGVEAFAVSGYGGTHNPAHEMAVKEVLSSMGDLPVVCGHELSAKLNFIRRAHTAVLNAQLIPVIDELLQAVVDTLKRHNVDVPVFVVRGDASLIEMSAARQRAIETILSGPAASAVGGRFLTGRDDIVAVDIGGTTTDVAIVSEGRVSVCSEGATVGQWQTSVGAADIMTTGLGGDSYVKVLDGGVRVEIGPERVVPLSFLSAQHPFVAEHLARTAESAAHEFISPLAVEFFELVRMRPGVRLSAQEATLVEALSEGPISRHALARAVGSLSIQLLPVGRLQRLGVVRRSAFTPTDALHVLGQFTGFDSSAARSAARTLAAPAKWSEEDFAGLVRDEFDRRLAHQVMRRELSLQFGDPDGQDNGMLKALLAEMIARTVQSEGPFSVRFTERRTVVGIGAPAAAFMPDAGRLLGAEVEIPEHAEVANAVGAVAGKVVIRESVSIRPDESGCFIMMGPLGRKEFRHLSNAQEEAARHLVDYLRRKAELFGTDEREVSLNVAEKVGRLADGSRQLLELAVDGLLEGHPRASA